MQEIIAQLRNELSGKLTPSRYEHTISVSFTAAALAMRYGCDLDKAELAGLLHDCAKHYSNETIIKKCEKQKITLTEDEKQAAEMELVSKVLSSDAFFSMEVTSPIQKVDTCCVMLKYVVWRISAWR